MPMYRQGGKRFFDWLIASVAIVVLLPVFFVLAVILIPVNRGAILFIQERPGWKERPFKFIKFKTMTDARDEQGKLLADKVRLTRFGRLLRNLSLDELPQLFNVWKGDMSLVGPRPLLFKYLPLYNEEQRRRHEVRPGITGLAQVNGRNSIPWKEKFAYDVEYIDKVSFGLDLRILWLTFIKVLKREGINQSAERPMQPFSGNN